mgnify:FL=1|tara:strand:+ start:2203 stop:2325 length:123 start_codon:yes stop_codon:yes gene_type:complete
MKDKILEVLEAVRDLEINLESEIARVWLAEKIAKNIQESP